MGSSVVVTGVVTVDWADVSMGFAGALFAEHAIQERSIAKASAKNKIFFIMWIVLFEKI